MEKLQKSDLEQILGIYSPYSIRSMELNPVDETLLLVLEESAHKSRFSLRAKPSSKREADQSNKQSFQWQHVRLGRFTTYIKARINPNSTNLNRFTFLGDASKQYSYGLQQLVEQCKSRGLDSDGITALLGVDLVTTKSILMDLEASESERRAEAVLPLESDPIWRAILTHDVNLTTKLLPLKLLLSRLKLNVYNKKDAETVQGAVAELRQFFAQHAHQLKGEYAQLGITLSTATSEPKAKSKLKLKLPGLNNPIWVQILSGTFDLHSRDMPLNLFITKLKKQFADCEDENAQRLIISDLQSFFKKNARSLIPELKILTRIITGESENGTSSASLPQSDHVIWQRLLENQASLPTDKMNYLLLLSKLRSTLLSSEDETVRSNAMQQLHDFFVQNQSLMTNEIKQINELSVAM